MERMTIGRMAKLNHISEQTLRLYDRMGLLSPSECNPENGYRYYDIRQSARLDMIQHLKSLGMNLKEVKQLLDGGDFKLTREALERKKAEIDRQMEELRRRRLAIDRTVRSFERYENAPPDGTVLLEYLESRPMYCVDARINFYDYGIEVYEQMLRELKGSLVKNHLPQIYFCNAGTILRRERFAARRFYSTEVFVFVDREFVPAALVSTIPAGCYLCIYCGRFEDEKEYALRLLREVEERGWQIAGDYICEVVAEPPARADERAMFLRLQVPVRFR